VLVQSQSQLRWQVPSLLHTVSVWKRTHYLSAPSVASFLSLIHIALGVRLYGNSIDFGLGVCEDYLNVL
jgi:hypothetical protein